MNERKEADWGGILVPVSVVSVGILLRLLPYFEIQPLAAWRFSAKFFEILMILGGGAVGFMIPKRRANRWRKAIAIGVSALIAVASLVAYNSISADPPTPENLKAYHTACLAFFLSTFAATGFCLVNIGKVIQKNGQS